VIQLHSGDHVSHCLEGLQRGHVDLESKQGNECVPSHHGRVRLGQTRQNRVLGPADRDGTPRLVDRLRNPQYDEHAGSAGTHQLADLRVDQGLAW